MAAAMLQYAPTDAKICTHIAIMTTGMNFPICRRICTGSRFAILINPGVCKSRYGGLIPRRENFVLWQRV
jgi:hypothetical protein